MGMIAKPEFLAWAEQAGINTQPYHALSFRHSPVEARYWQTPLTLLGASEMFVNALCEGLGEWSRLMFWPVDWVAERAAAGVVLCRIAAKAVGPGLESDGALSLDRDDMDVAKIILLSSMGLGEDTYVVSDLADVVLFVDHHDVVWAQFKSQARCDQFVECIQRNGFELPRSPPDPTFRAMSWMDRV